MTRMWMVRGEGGRLYDGFRERGVVAVGWADLAERAEPGMTRKQLIGIYRSLHPKAKQGSVVAGASQVWRLVNEMQPGDWVTTYSPANRTYLVGKVSGAAQYHAQWVDDDMPLARTVEWDSQEIQRDDLSGPSKNSLGSTLTVFRVPETAARELVGRLSGAATAAPDEDELLDEAEEETAVDPLANIEDQSLERIKDMVSALEWGEMEKLVAGILRAMGYKTQLSQTGPDRGVDIIASPDGFGFENPRIVVEVKHRKGQMNSQAIRSFLGGRHKDDRGLYVSTGGFSQDARYEADRAAVPLTLWTLDNLVRTLVEHYDTTDAETKRLVPLKRMYWPA